MNRDKLKDRLNYLIEAAGFTAIVAAIFYVCVYLAPPQRSAECDRQYSLMESSR